MKVNLIIRLFEFEKEGYEDYIYSTGLDFEVEGLPPEGIDKRRLKLPSGKRRDIAIKLLSGIRWKLEYKSRNFIQFSADVPEELWKAFETLCHEKYRLTAKRYNEWMSMKPEELVKQFKIIELSSELAEEGDYA